MLEAYITFDGKTGNILNFMGNKNAIQAPQVVRTASGRYTITFFTAREIDAAQIGNSIVQVNCQNPAGSGTVNNVIPSPQATYNPNAPLYP